MSKNFFFLLSLVIFFLVNYTAKAQDNIAFIDLNIIFDNSNAGKKINKSIEGKRKKNSKSFKELQKKFEVDREKLLAKKNVISKDEFDKQILSLEKNLKEYNNRIKKENNELTNFQIKARKNFFNSLRPILEKYAKDNSIDIILKKENVLIGKTNLDISKNILEIFNKEVKKISVE
tara:strand:- start:621 stop:1148 length:528 start_codon:yes stop_codon:yes gene_type:complete